MDTAGHHEGGSVAEAEGAACGRRAGHGQCWPWMLSQPNPVPALNTGKLRLKGGVLTPGSSFCHYSGNGDSETAACPQAPGRTSMPGHRRPCSGLCCGWHQGPESTGPTGQVGGVARERQGPLLGACGSGRGTALPWRLGCPIALCSAEIWPWALTHTRGQRLGRLSVTRPRAEGSLQG